MALQQQQRRNTIRVSSDAKVKNHWMYRCIWLLLGVELASGVLQLFIGAMIFNCLSVPQAIVVGEIMALVAVSLTILEKVISPPPGRVWTRLTR